MTRVLRLAAVAVLATILVPLSPGRALACSCVPGDDAQHFSVATLVFTGVVTSREDAQAEGTVTSTADPITWTFEVEQVHKGVADDEVEVRSAREENACGFVFSVGARFQVFAHAGDPPTTNLCSGTRLLAGGAQPYEPSPPTALIVGAVLGALALVWSFRRMRDMRLPIDPEPPGRMD